MENVNYAFINSKESGSLVFRSTVESFGLNHETDKDILSFYTNFSRFAYMDTGLLPVNGSGLLSIRSAGQHTQIAYQHAPDKYYINWGDYEGDRGAIKYYVAQPYRIVIADLVNGNILGARTFYSPVPITYPALPLYHVNLPNINCRGYRGNGVGWICLYHSEDISQYPFNEKLAKILDRCSGTEAYNDQNMSETDGPRFYCSHNKPEHIWNPKSWQEYTEKNGVDWTLDPDLWIPVLVKDLDNQDKHYDDGQPLTFVDALFGNYKAYYVDELIPKPVNALARTDLNITANEVFNWFKNSYNSSTNSFVSINPFNSSANIKEKLSSPVFIDNTNDEEEDDEDDENYMNCVRCDCSIHSENDDYSIIFYTNEILCLDCTDIAAVYVEHLNSYCWSDHESLVLASNGQYYNLDHWSNYTNCSCGTSYVWDKDTGISQEMVNVWNASSVDDSSCPECIHHLQLKDCNDEMLPTKTCYKCKTYIPNIYAYDKSTEITNIFGVQRIQIIDELGNYDLVGVCNACYHTKCSALEKSLISGIDDVVCACGSIDHYSKFTQFSSIDSQKLIGGMYEYTEVSGSEEVNKAVLGLKNNNIYSNISQFSEEPSFVATFEISAGCPTCVLYLSLHGVQDYMKFVGPKLISTINNKLTFNQKLDQFYGVNFYIHSIF